MAQTAADQPPAEAEPVYHIGTVTIKFVGMANVNEQIVRANMALREDTDLDESLIDRDIRSLYKTGLFEFIEVKRETIAGNGVNLILEVTPKFRVLAVRYEGNKAYKEKRLQKEIKTVANGALDERQIKDDAQKIYEFYQKNGFNQAQVTFSLTATGAQVSPRSLSRCAKAPRSASAPLISSATTMSKPASFAERSRPRNGICSPGSLAAAD